jgi:hypothetical protein
MTAVELGTGWLPYNNVVAPWRGRPGRRRWPPRPRLNSADEMITAAFAIGIERLGPNRQRSPADIVLEALTIARAIETHDRTIWPTDPRTVWPVDESGVLRMSIAELHAAMTRRPLAELLVTPAFAEWATFLWNLPHPPQGTDMATAVIQKCFAIVLDNPQGLGSRNWKILMRSIAGWSDTEIAEFYPIARRMVRRTINRVLNKLGARLESLMPNSSKFRVSAEWSAPLPPIQENVVISNCYAAFQNTASRGEVEKNATIKIGHSTNSRVDSAPPFMPNRASFLLSATSVATALHLADIHKPKKERGSKCQ